MKQKQFCYQILIFVLMLTMLLTSCNTKEEQIVEIQENQTIDIENFSDSVATTLEEVTVTIEQPATKNGLTLNILGATVYDKLESEEYIDTPSQGMKYLVVFLNIKNITSLNDYFNYNYLKAQLDGIEIEDTFLLNNPEGYKSIKTDLPDEMITQGYLVWEVPENWEKLEITYTGWNEKFYLEPTLVITPDDLQVPEEYSEYNRII